MLTLTLLYLLARFTDDLDVIELIMDHYPIRPFLGGLGPAGCRHDDP